MFWFRLSRSKCEALPSSQWNAKVMTAIAFRELSTQRPVQTSRDLGGKCRIITGQGGVQPVKGNTGVDLWEVIRQQQCAWFKKILKESLFSLVQINEQMCLVWSVLTKCSKDMVLKRLKSYRSSNFHLPSATPPDFSQLSLGEGQPSMEVQGTWTRPKPWVKCRISRSISCVLISALVN